MLVDWPRVLVPDADSLRQTHRLEQLLILGYKGKKTLFSLIYNIHRTTVRNTALRLQHNTQCWVTTLQHNTETQQTTTQTKRFMSMNDPHYLDPMGPNSPKPVMNTKPVCEGGSPTRVCSTWLGHIHLPAGRVVAGGSRQSMWNSSGQKSHCIKGPLRQLLSQTATLQKSDLSHTTATVM